MGVMFIYDCGFNGMQSMLLKVYFLVPKCLIYHYANECKIYTYDTDGYTVKALYFQSTML